MFSTRYDPDINGFQDTTIPHNKVNLKKRKRERNVKQINQIEVESEFQSDPVTEVFENNSDLKVKDVLETEQDPLYQQKHSSIFDKFKQSIELKHIEEEINQDDLQDLTYQDLTPFPQPELPRDNKLSANTTHLKNLDWLAEPQYVSTSNSESFQNFNLSPFMLKNLNTIGFDNAFAVQVAVLHLMIPEIRSHRLTPDFQGDILVNASTGSGKTLAYSIPIVEALHKRVVPRLRAIILVPTKPLINQVRTTLLQLSQGTNLNIVSLRNDISIKDESNKLRNSIPDVIVCTPGRLVDHVAMNSIDLSMLQFLIIDEADKLLNQSFQNWSSILMNKITHHVNISQEWKLPVQKLVFSATLTTDAGKLSNLNFQKPRLIIVNDSNQLVNEMFQVPSTLKEYKLSFGVAKNSIKPLILSKFLISQNKLSNVLIFTKSNEASIRLSKILQNLFEKFSLNINVEYINSTNNKTTIRHKILRDFTNQNINILVATDLIARGIDLTSISDVINYDLPNSSREYIHRVGRTARANQIGSAYNLIFGKGETQWFETISKDIGRNEKVVEEVNLELKDMIDEKDDEIYQECLSNLQEQSRK